MKKHKVSRPKLPSQVNQAKISSFFSQRPNVVEVEPPTKTLSVGEAIGGLSLSKNEDNILSLKKMPLEECFMESKNSPLKKIKLGRDDDFISEDIFLLDEYFKDDDICLEKESNGLDLSVWQRCLVKVVIAFGSSITLKLQSVNNDTKGVCLLADFWTQTQVVTGDTISIIAVKNEADEYCVSNLGGYVVVWPDRLITGTEIVGSLFCMRKSILQSSFRGIDPGNKSMAIGSLVHELLQSCLDKGISSLQYVTLECESILKSNDSVRLLYECGMKSDEASCEIKKYIPHIVDFMQTYASACRQNSKKNGAWKGTIDKVIDIEENIWSPNFGISGRIDATVQVTIHENPKRKVLMPLELKTGKHQNSPEHRGQVILYTMIMSLLNDNRPIDEGLLLYLRDSAEVKQITANYAEKRDLIILRNNLAHYMNKWQNGRDDTLAGGIENLDLLPNPINHHSACKNCPYLTLCSVYLSKNSNCSLPENHLLMKLKESAIGHLKSDDIDYFLKWSSLINLEDNDKRESIERKDIWNVPASEREQRGKCLSKMSAHSVQRIFDGKYEVVFKKHSNPNETILHCQFQPGNYVVIGTDSKYAQASGFVSKISNSSLTVVLNKDLTKRNPKSASYNIDAYDSTSSLVYNLTNLGLLMDNTDAANNLRDIVVSKIYTPSEDKLSKSIVEKGVGIFKKLNEVQIRAVLKALTTHNFMLIKGMPGTGKTQTLVALVELLVRLNKSVLITSHTHSAIDNVFLRLKNCNVKMIRLAAESRVHRDLQEFTETELTKHCTSPEDLEEVYRSVNVVGVTCLGSNHSLLSKRTFDICIVDESTQVLQSTILRPLFAAKKFVLVGDPDQLPPIVRSNKARSLGMDESLFDRLDNLGATISLTLQYRMNKTIMNLANKLTYCDQLKCANETVKNSTLTLKTGFENERWLKMCLSTSLQDSFVIVDTGTIQDMESYDSFQNRTKYSNLHECALMLRLVVALLGAGVERDRIGIIAPYRDQVSLIKSVFEKFTAKNKDSLVDKVDVSTVDQYQGKDKDVVLYSCAEMRKSDLHSLRSMENYLLEDKRRLTVAVTRAKYKLIVVGDVESLKRYRPFRKLFESAQFYDIGLRLSLPEMIAENRFSWKNVLELLPS